jgi:hypothetical protein
MNPVFNISDYVDPSTALNNVLVSGIYDLGNYGLSQVDGYSNVGVYPYSYTDPAYAGSIRYLGPPTSSSSGFGLILLAVLLWFIFK